MTPGTFSAKPQAADKASSPPSEDILLCRYPHKVTVRQAKEYLTRTDDEARERLADLILHRLKDRYITPLENVRPRRVRSGFLMMAAACLMIETFQCFRDGQKHTKDRGAGAAAFSRFFSNYSTNFPGINAAEFYAKIRCGILHQAQTQGRYRILRTGKIFDEQTKCINATRFLKTLKQIVEEYVQTLRHEDVASDLWQRRVRKSNSSAKPLRMSEQRLTRGNAQELVLDRCFLKVSIV